MSHGAQDGHSDLSTSLARLELDLRLAIALRESRPLREAVLGDQARLLLVLPAGAGWVSLSPDDVLLSRARPHAFAAPERPFVDLFDEAFLPSSTEAERALEAAGAGARRLVTSVFGDDRRGYRDLAEWAPLAEIPLYAVSARLMAGLDVLRGDVRQAVAEGRPEADAVALAYRRTVNALGRATLLSTDTGSDWLSHMAADFDWVTWTPSFPLVRERDLWSTLIGARAASRFGPTVIDRYLGALRRARRPVPAIDTLLGLVAIATRHPGERGALIHSLDSELAKLSEREILRPDIAALAHAEARRVLVESEDIRLASISRREDAFHIDRMGRMPVFELVRGAVECPAWKFIPSERRPDSGHKARESFIQAWGPDAPSALEDFGEPEPRQPPVRRLLN